MPDIADRIARLRAGTRLPADLEWLRVTAPFADSLIASDFGALSCDCRCRCHDFRESDGILDRSCGLAIDLDTLDCGRACRSAHILASECDLDETRERVAAHV